MGSAVSHPAHRRPPCPFRMMTFLRKQDPSIQSTERSRMAHPLSRRIIRMIITGSTFFANYLQATDTARDSYAPGVAAASVAIAIYAGKNRPLPAAAAAAAAAPQTAPPPPSSPGVCTNTCLLARDGICRDLFSWCAMAPASWVRRRSPSRPPWAPRPMYRCHPARRRPAVPPAPPRPPPRPPGLPLPPPSPSLPRRRLSLYPRPGPPPPPSPCFTSLVLPRPRPGAHRARPPSRRHPHIRLSPPVPPSIPPQPSPPPPPAIPSASPRHRHRPRVLPPPTPPPASPPPSAPPPLPPPPLPSHLLPLSRQRSWHTTFIYTRRDVGAFRQLGHRRACVPGGGAAWSGNRWAAMLAPEGRPGRECQSCH